MSGSNRIAITISAVDGASAKLEAINKRLAAMSAPVTRLTKSFSRFGDASGITKLSKGFQDLGNGSLNAFRNISRVVDPLAAITGAASIAGMVKLTTAWADFGSQLGFSAQRLGMTAGTLQTFQGAATLAGSSSSALSSGMQALGQNMWNAVGGRAPEIVAAFSMLHLNFRKVGGSAKSVADMMPLIADKIKSIQNPFAQAAVATALFGGAGQDLLPLLRLGSAGMADYERHAKAYGVFTAAGVAAANNLRMAQVDLTLSVQGLGNSIAQRLEPVMVPMIKSLAQWIANNRGLIAQDVTSFVQKLSQRLPAVGKEIQGIVNLFGGWTDAARDLAVFMGASWFIRMMAPITAVTTALLRVIALQATAAGVPVAAVVGAAGAAGAAAIAAFAAAYLTGQKVKLSPAQTGVRDQGMNYFMSQGWSRAHAAGIMGNAQVESGFNPGATSPPDRNGVVYRGLFQDDPARWALLTKQYGPNPTAAQQFAFAQSEMLAHPAWMAALHNSPNAGAAGFAFDNSFENPQGDHSMSANKRASYAQYIAGLNASGPPANIGNGSGSTQAPTAGVVKVDITHANAPPGTTTQARASGPGVAIRSLKVVKSMAGGSL